MAKKIIVPAKSQRIRIVNRCIMCGKVIPVGNAICSTCNNKRVRALKKSRR